MSAAIEAIAAVSGVLGSYLLAIPSRWAKYGWCVYLVSNLCWIGFAVGGGYSWLLLQSVAFLGSSVWGVYAHVLFQRTKVQNGS